jgi:TatA/E family protein of Tat protein translocase
LGWTDVLAALAEDNPMIRSIGLPELIVIGAVFILLFGGKKIGELGKGVGEALRELKKTAVQAKDAEKELKR